MPDYSKGKIYKIVDNTNGNIYIGSTCEPTLARRLSGHVKKYNEYINGKYKGNLSSLEIIKNANYDIILIENYPCEIKDELHARERHYIDYLECVNRVIPKRTINEWREINKEDLKTKQKVYAQNNKEKIKETQKKYSIEHSQDLKEKRKIRYENNKELVLTKMKTYYENNKEAILNKQKEKYVCDCGGHYTYKTQARHRKSKIHQVYITNSQTEV